MDAVKRVLAGEVATVREAINGPSAKATRKPNPDDASGLVALAQRNIERGVSMADFLADLIDEIDTGQGVSAHWKQLRSALITISRLPDAREICPKVPRSSREWVADAVPSVMAWLADFEACRKRKLMLAAAVRESNSPEGARRRAKARGGRTE